MFIYLVYKVLFIYNLYFIYLFIDIFIYLFIFFIYLFMYLFICLLFNFFSMLTFLFFRYTLPSTHPLVANKQVMPSYPTGHPVNIDNYMAVIHALKF